MSINTEIGARLRQFGEHKYTSMAEFARALKIKPQQIYDYFNGKSAPGNRMQDKLRVLGCDINWLMTGMDREEANRKFSEMVARISKQELTKGEMEIIAILRTLKIAEPIDFHVYFDYARAVQDKIKKGTEKPQVKNRTPKKRRESK
jgi:transcriptional regulator with XRE-family HTH domain